ncbi:MAG: PAS domain S-box protein, partial [bacterium]
MKNIKSDLLREIESLKTENQRINMLTNTIQNPELQWWAKRNAEVVLGLDENHEVISVTPSVSYLLGYEPSELIGKDLDWLVHSFDQPILKRQFEVTRAEQGSEITVHVRLIHKDNSWLWIEATLTDQTGNPEVKALMVVFRVLKMAKELHGEGSLQRVRYYDLLNAVSDGLFVCIMRADGSSGHFIEANNVACSMLGYEKEDLLHLSFKEIDSEYDEEEFRDKGKKLLAGEGLMFETLLNKRDGSIFPVEIHASIYRLEEQRAMISIIRDISARRQTEGELQKNYAELEFHKKQLESQYRELTVVREELEESLGNYSFLYDFAPSGYFSLGRDSTMHRLNLRAATLLGMERSGLIGMKFNRFVEQQSLVEFQNFLRNIFEIKGKADCEIILKGDEQVYMVIRLEGIISDDGLDCFAMAMDITERKKAEEALTESEAKFQNAFEYATNGIALVSVQGKFLRVNQSLCRILGYTHEELINKTFMEITHPDDVSNNVDYLKQVQRGEIETFEVEKRYFHKSGNIVWAVLSSSIVRNDDRSPRFFISQVQDITARKFAEEQISLSEHKYRTLFETMIQGVVYQDGNGKIISANPSALRILGVSFDQLIGRTSMDPQWHVIHEDGSPYPGETHPAIVSLQTGKESSGLMGIYNPVAGKYSWINVSARPEFRPGEDKPFQVYTTFEEITKLKESLEELKLTSERLSILRQIDHTLNNMDWNDVAVNEMAMKAILKMIPCQKIYILSFDHEKGEAIVESKVDRGIFESNLIKRVPLGMFNLSKFDGDKTYVKHIDKHNPSSDMEKWAVSMGLSDVLAIPFLSEERMFGVFAMVSDSPDLFNSENIQLAEDIGAQISMNLHKRELHRQLTQYTEGLEQRVEERTKELQSLSNIQKAILNSVPDLMFRISREGTFLDVHSSKRDVLYTSPEIFLGKKINDVLPPEVAGASMKALQEGFLSKETVTYEYKLPVGDEIRYYESRIISISDNEALAIIRDITDRKNAERALRWNESLLRMMTTSSPLAFFVVDNRNDDILYFNHQFCEIWGINHLEEQMKKRKLKNNDIIPHCLPVLKDIEAFAASCKPLQFEENQVVLEDVIPFLDGRFIHRFSTQIRDTDDQYYGRLYIFEDITQRKVVEQFIVIQRDLAIGLSASLDLEQALALGLEAALKLELVDGGGIYLLDDQKMELKLVVHSGLSEEFIRNCSRYDKDTHQFQLVLSGNMVSGPYEKFASTGVLTHSEEMIHGLSVIPIQHEGRVVGCLNIGSKKSS